MTEVSIMTAEGSSFSISALSAASPLSDLFKRTIALRPATWLIICMSSSSRGLLASMTNIIRSALDRAVLLFSMPIFSIMSSVSRIPAVSVITTGIFFITMLSSIISLVVPGISVTMALFSPIRTFISDDFPTLGLPTIDTERPSLMILPVSAVESSLEIFSFTFLTEDVSFSYVISSMSSSG